MNVPDVSHITDQQLVEKFGPLDKLFTEADVDGDSQISAEEAKNFFPRFGVPTPVLGNIWRMSSRTKGGLTREEFKTSMRHIYAFMFSASFQPIRTTPSPGPLDPSPSSSPVPIANSAFDFSISLQERQAYEKHFFTVSQGMPYVTEINAVPFFKKAQIDDISLAKIYSICDFEKNGQLDKDEFVIAFHLIRLKRKVPTLIIPEICPEVLIPPQKKHLLDGPIISERPRSMSNTPDLGGFMGSPSPQLGGPNLGGPTPLNPSFGGPSMGGPPRAMSGPSLTGMNVGQVEMNVNRLLDESKSLNQSLFPVQQNNEQQRYRLEDLNRQKQELEQQVQRERSELMQAEQEKMRLETQIAEFESKIELLRSDSQGFQGQYQKVRDEVARLTELRQQAYQAENDLSSEIDGYRGELQNGLGEFMNVKEELVQLNVRIQELALQKQQISESSSSKVQEEQRLRSDLRNAQSQFNQLQSEVNSLQIKLGDVDRSSQNSKQELERLVSQTNEQRQKLNTLQTQLQNSRSNVNSAKLLRLKEIVKKVEEFISEFDNTMKQEFPDSPQATVPFKVNQSAFTPIETKFSPQKSTSSPNTPTNPPVVPSTQTKSNHDDFGASFDEFDNDFGSFPSNPSPASKTVSPPPPTVQAPQPPKTGFGDFAADFTDDFSHDFGGSFESTPTLNTSKNAPVVADKQPTPTKQASPFEEKPTTSDDWATSFDSQPTEDVWSTFETNNSKITSGNNLNDDWDDFGASPASTTPAAKLPPPPKKSSDFADFDAEDDWGNF